ncbi:MAG: type IX secretion system membrane protein PorP/SprF [Filimonas sp.]|nr:type IX secretion system membrane protein PorP/SprF [Filimonas sp.]
MKKENKCWLMQLATLVLLVAFSLPVSAQQDPLYSQYMFNGTMINPSYASMDDAISTTVVLRNQWVGLDGAPKTGSLTFSMPANYKGTNLGGLLSYDKIGNISRTSIGFNAAQKVMLSEDLFLGLGLRVSEDFYRENNEKFNTVDPVFMENKSYTKTSVGWGMTLYSPRFFLGLSSPGFQSMLNQSSQKFAITNRPHYFLQAAYLFDAGENIKIKPNVLVQYVSEAPVSTDLNLNVLFKETFWAGASWRSSGTVTGILQWQLTENFQVGYSYDYNYGKTLSQIQSGSHELMLNYRLGRGRGNRIITPRYF